MRCDFATDLPKLGHREYIQGGSIINDILDRVDEVLGRDWLKDTVITSFKLQRESFGNGRLIIADAAQHDVEANAAFIAKSPRQSLYAYYVDEGRPARREAYDEESYYRIVEMGRQVGGMFIFPGGRPRGDFVRAVVGANKRVHQKAECFGTALEHIQFLYLRGLEGTCLLRSGEECRVGISNVSIQDRETEVWTINRVAVSGETFQSEFRICYRGTREGE